MNLAAIPTCGLTSALKSGAKEADYYVSPRVLCCNSRDLDSLLFALAHDKSVQVLVGIYQVQLWGTCNEPVVERKENAAFAETATKI